MKNRESFGASRLLSVALAAAVVLGLTAQSLWADELYGRIRGVVSDPTGAVVAGVAITVTNTATGLQKTETTGPDGSYEFFTLPPGTYNLKATKQGFRAYQLQKITVVVTQIYVASFKLEVGATSEVVQVEANPVQVETTSIQLGNTLTAGTITGLPLNGRNWIELQQTLPGVSQADRFTNNYATNGSQSQQNSFLVNGNDTNDLPINTPLVTPNPDAIAEVQMITNTINPEFGRNSGAIMNAITKSGTNAFHGTGFEFFRDTSLNSKPYFSLTRQAFHRNQYGGTFGGPVKNDKAFFFFGYQGQHQRSPQSTASTQTVFTQAQRSGDFSNLWAQNKGVCPLTKPVRDSRGNVVGGVSPFRMLGEDGTWYPAGTAYCTLFPTGHIPQADLNPLAVSLLKYVPLPNSGTNQYLFGPIQKGNYNEYLGRFDSNLTGKDQFWAYFLRRGTINVRDLPFTGATVPGFGDQALSHVTQSTASWIHTFNPDTLNEARIGYTRLNYAAVSPQQVVQPASLGFTGITSGDSKVAGAPRINVGGMFNLGFSTNGPQPRIDQTYQFTDNLSKTVGRHTMKMGFDMRRFQVWNPFFAVNNGYFSFAGNGTYSSNLNSTTTVKNTFQGLNGIDFLLGIPDSFSESSPGIIDARAREYYSYFQDQWKVKDNLTLTYGVGWQIDTPIYQQQFNGLAVNCFSPTLAQSTVYPSAPAGLLFPGDKGCNSAGGPTTKYGHFGPRFGFAYSPDLGAISGGPGKMSLRGGFGIYYNRFEEETMLQSLGAYPFSAGYSGAAQVGGSPSFANPWVDITGNAALSFANPFPYVIPSPGSPVDFSQYYPMQVNAFDPNMSLPYAMNYNLTVQRELPARTVLTTAYVGAMARKLLTWTEANPNLEPTECALYSGCRNRYVMGFNYPEFFRYDPTVFGGIGVQQTRANSNYNSLQVTVEKAQTHGLTLRAAYTYAHSLDTNSSFEGNSFTSHGNFPFDLSRDYGDSDFDVRHRLVLTYNYELPNLHSVASLLPNRVFGGWRIGGITTLQTGVPFAIYDTTDRSLQWWYYSYVSFGVYPNWNGTYTQYNARGSATGPGGTPNTKNYYFDPSSFTQAAFGTVGNMRRNVLHGPGINNTDFILAKSTSITEGKELELRFEFFNFLNHTQFSAPSGSITSTYFGRSTSTRTDPRVVQLGAKFTF